MEEELSRMKNFLKDFFNNEQSPTSEEATRIGNYTLDREDVSGHVIDWVINYLDNRKCPYSLAVDIAKEIALQISTSLIQNDAEHFEKMCNSADLYSEAINKIPAVCNAFSNQVNLEPISSTKFPTSVFAIRNKRRKMEDRHVILHDLNAVLDLKDAPYQSYYAVFDGHSGIDAACYASAQLHVNIGKHSDFLTNTANAIIEGYQITDKNFLNKCNKLNIKSGCTALSALIRNNTIFLSWLGDSQAVLVKEGVPVKITNPHKPDREDERQRIEQLGGHVSHMGTWRVNGLLAVTRAIGDPDQKPYISSEPELDIIHLDGTEDFLILACDGLWDGISPEDASSALYRYLADSSPDDLINPAAAKLVHQSKLQGSEDNITAIVVFLRDVKDILNNVDKFVANSSMYYVQNRDFMSMNGNMKIFSMDSNSDASFSKPTVLELNAASSKKLKNAANVMSSAGFGSTSYNYQFVENLDENSFHSLESSVDTSQTVYMSQAAHSASCFAPEATALSELPTPPIDDMLASQQFDSFCSTDLYKELSNSVQASEQHLENANKPVDKIEESLEVNAENESLINIESDSGLITSSALSPNEAVGIASDVVSTTIETAVNLAEESLELTSVQSSTKLNPYAKPFVMKSFFSAEESDPMSSSFIGNSLGDIASPCEVTHSQLDSQSVTGIVEEIDSQVISKDLKKDQLSNVVLSEPNTDHMSLEPLVLEQSLNSENTSDKLPLEVPSIESESKIPELSTETAIKSTDANNLIQSFSNPDLLGEFQCNNMIQTDYSQVSFEKSDYFSENIAANLPVEADLSDVHQLKMDFEKMELGSLESESDIVEKNISASKGDILSPTVDKLNQSLSSEIPTFPCELLEFETVEECVTQPVNAGDLTSEQNQKLDNISGLSFDNISSDISKIDPNFGIEYNAGNIEKDVEKILDSADKETISVTNIQVDQLQIKEAEQLLISDSINMNSEENTMPVSNQNSELSNISDGVDVKSKLEEIQKSIVDAVAKSENSELSSFVEPISLISNIKDELISVESEVPSDPSVEDSRVEPVAVDLKSLPEGIPEAEGVTEDIDSDSEKDGGWSYMKGNTVTGSKSKSEEKMSKTMKSNETKSNIATKSKRDLSKPNLDIKSKVKNISVDKTKSSLPDKSKTVSQDKTKNVADRTKGITSVDKTRTFGSSDKNKMKTVEKKTDVKSKILKSSIASTVTKTVSDKTSRIVNVSSSIKKETSETTGTSAVTKPTRPTTLLRTTVASVKPISTTVGDKSALSNRGTAKPKVTPLLSDKPLRPNVASSTIHKGSTSVQNKSSTLSNRTTTARPGATVPIKTSTIARTTIQKSTASEPKPKLPSSSVVAARKPLSAASKKPDVKEVKDSVNKQILAKKTTTTSRIESNSTLTSKRAVSYNNKSASTKAPAAAKTQISKKDVPKITSSKVGIRKPDSKVTQDVSKNKEKIIETVQVKTDEAKDNSNVESEQKNVTEAAQVVEEKFILETNDKEIPKEVKTISNEEQNVENGSLNKTVLPDAECNPENIS